MATSIFVNFATTDLERAKTFYSSLGFVINPMFSDDNGACLVVDDNVYFMVLTREHFASFIDKTVADPKTTTSALVSLSRESRAEVDELIANGIANGGTEPGPAQDLGFMYSRGLEDPDGNAIDFFFMEPAAIEAGPENFMAELAGNDDAAPGDDPEEGGASEGN